MDPVLASLIETATRAPSGHNTQPWSFSLAADTIRIFPDFSRRLPVVDPDDHAIYISLGCALENLVIATAHHGLATTVDAFPGDEAEPCLRVRVTPSAGGGADPALYQAIARRQTNRRRYRDRALAPGQVARLLDAGARDGVELRSFDPADPDSAPLLDLVAEASRAQFGDRAFVDELVSWIRFSRREAQARGDGLGARALGFPTLPRWLGRLVMTRLAGPGSEARRQVRLLRSAPLAIVFIARRHDPAGWVALGRAFQRTALAATSMAIAHGHVNMPCEVPSVRRKLASWLGLDPAWQPLLLVRFGHADPMPASSRRRLEEVMRPAAGVEPA